METNEILAIASVISAIGTLSLAFFTYRTIKASKTQLDYLRAQTKLFTKEQEPLITIQEKKFNHNTIQLLLKNYGGGIAYDIALETQYYLTKQELDDESKQLLLTTPPEMRNTLQLKCYDRLIHEQGFKIKREVLHLNKQDIRDDPFLAIQPWFVKAKIRKEDFYFVYPERTITFIFSKSSNQTLLEPKKDGEWFEAEPFFMWNLSKKRNSQLLAPCKGNTFDELVEYFKENNIYTFGITFDLISKDCVSRVIHHERIDTCIVDLREHKTIEDAIKDGHKVYFTPIGWKEMQGKIRWMSKSHYEAKRLEND